PRDGHRFLAACVDLNDCLQISLEFLDLATLFWLMVAGPMSAPRMGLTVTLRADGRVFVTGGLSDLNWSSSQIEPITSALASTEFYNPATDSWTPGPSMSRPRAGHAAIPLPDGRILFAGGVGYTTLIIRIPQIWAQTEIYDPVSNTFSPGPSMSRPRAIFAVADLGGGRFLVAGGVSDLLGLGAPTDEAEIYDATTNSWSPAGRMAQARSMAVVLPLGSGRFAIAGGADGTLAAPNAIASTEVYDAATNAFTSGPALNVTRAAAGVFLAPTGQYHVIGGGTGQTGTSTTTTEWFYR